MTFMKNDLKKGSLAKKGDSNCIATSILLFDVVLVLHFHPLITKKYWRLVQMIKIFCIPFFCGLTLFQSNVLTRASHLFFF